MMKSIQILSALLLSVLTVLPSQAGIIPWLKGENGEAMEVPTLAPMLRHVLPAVVNIAASGKVVIQDNPLLQDPFFRHFFRGLPPIPRERRTQSVGSGVIVDARNGYIITNHHVIKNAETIYVILKDKRRLKAKLVGSDPETDIAVLKVKGDGLDDLPMGDSDKLQVGDFVVAIGNPFGLGQTVTSGIVSALGRTGLGIEGYENFIQTDASINPGNSGGALVDLRGRLVGINTAIVAPSGGNVGIGFAIPINMAREVMEQIVEYGGVKRGMLGVQVQDLTPELAKAMGLETHEGALVSGVTKGSAAEKAGIQPGDVIIRFDGKKVTSSAQLRNLVGLKRVGEKAEIELIRDGRRITVTAVIGKPSISGAISGEIPLLEGAYFSDIPPDHPLYGEVQGVLVAGVEMGSPAWYAGLRKGDIILSVNRKRVKSVDEFIRIASQSPNRLLLRIQRGNFSLFLVLER
ncbi:MAG TPA: DegQ family serine endoprotease [Methylothermaceae bacterium]|nr:DegQ family serine endoprotease [Methylothermaceae bacterium]